MEARMKQPALVVPGALDALLGLGKVVSDAAEGSALPGQPDQRVQCVCPHARPRCPEGRRVR